MKTNKSIIRTLLLFVYFAFSLSGCEKVKDEMADKGKPSGNDRNAPGFETGGAGTNYIFPNAFNLSGLLSASAGEYNPQVPGTPMELWMGVGNKKAGTLVGHVNFLKNPDRVQIDLTDIDGNGPDMFPYVVLEAHIHFAPTVDGIPHTKNGNPIPGQFEYNVKVDPTKSVIEIPVEFDAVGAIHLSVVKYGGVEGFNFYLPDKPVKMHVTGYNETAVASYFQLHVSGGGFISEYDMGYGEGIYEGWCIDADNFIFLNKEYDAMLYSSYESLPSWMIGEGKIENPENLDKVNYLVNNFKAGQIVKLLNHDCTPYLVDAAPVFESLTYSDIQMAIWSYLDNDLPVLPDWKQERVNSILCAADAGGKGFVPACTQKIVFLVVPVGPTEDSYNVQIVIGQPVIGQIEVPCETLGGTAWGDGKYGAGFPGSKQWGTYFLVGETTK